MNKSELRKKYAAVRASVKDRNELSSKIADFVINSEFYKKADKVFCYCATGCEVGTEEIIRNALSDKKKVALPKCTDKYGNMTFYYISSFDDLIEGMYGIPEPDTGFKADTSDSGSVCIVPGLAFDLKGYRLGYGKGYYDRFLETFDGVSVGVCFEACLTEAVPADKFDMKVNYIITDKTIYKV